MLQLVMKGVALTPVWSVTHIDEQTTRAQVRHVVAPLAIVVELFDEYDLLEADSFDERSRVKVEFDG